ncbi:MAG: DUF922 domain-containing protein [Patescibacteria group bacterium]
MQKNNLKTKPNNGKFFLILIIVLLIAFWMTAIFGLTFFAWKAYPIFLASKNKEATIQNIEEKNQEKAEVVVNDKLVEEIKTTYYDISGFTAEELNKQMQELGPESTSTERYYAMANYAIDWTLPLKTGNGCTPVDAEVNIEYIMPKWINYDEASIDMQQKWNTFYALLEKHEQNHGEIAKQEGEKFLQEIKNITNYNSCQEFDDKVYPIQEKYLIELSQLEDAYDVETNHGETEGVTLY